ncbi:MAG: hypothetical protein PHQ91_02795 [Thermoanaerobaculaceae bacterium]|nr:hypothetical protein [Thermoanaerobaculaceae bacterium]TAM56857.1 MAG: hypothetical protein EPN53_00815 [Acidobacteriota bacterium]
MAMTRPRAGHALLLLPLVAVATWFAARGRTARDDPGAVLAALRAAAGPSLPAAGAAGATARSEPAAYTRETLYEYIDGAAEAYLARGFERCVAATFTFSSATGDALDVTAEVYRFAAPAGAHAQMESERPAGAAPIPGLTEAFADPSTAVACRGRDYLKLTALTAGPGAEKVLAAMAAAWRQGKP